jgi:hypothetical protein
VEGETITTGNGSKKPWLHCAGTAGPRELCARLLKPGDVWQIESLIAEKLPKPAPTLQSAK